MSTTTDPIHWVRRAPHLGQELHWVYLSELRLDCRVGVGNPVDPGSDPQITLRLSRDGAHTWGPARTVSAGKIGQFRVRAVWRQLGRARTATFEVSGSDPVIVCLVDGYVDVRAGTERSAPAPTPEEAPAGAE